MVQSMDVRFKNSPAMICITIMQNVEKSCDSLTYPTQADIIITVVNTEIVGRITAKQNKRRYYQ